MKQFILSEHQLSILNPIVEQKNKAEMNLQNALLLVTGEQFNSYQIKDGVLIINHNSVVKEESKEDK